MLKWTRVIWTLLLLVMLLLLAGCDNGDGGGGDPCDPDDDDEKKRTFVIADTLQFPYPGKKEDCLISDKETNDSYYIFIYVINHGENWAKNDVRNIKVTYYDITRPGETVEYDQISIEKYDKHTYIRVDNISYPYDARGFFRVEGEIEQNKNKWYYRDVQSNDFNYGNPGGGSIPIDRDFILYEKEYVD